jgi:hypothetical protein
VKDEPLETLLASSAFSAEKSAALSSHVWTERIGWPCKRCDRTVKVRFGGFQLRLEFYSLSEMSTFVGKMFGYISQQLKTIKFSDKESFVTIVFLNYFSGLKTTDPMFRRFELLNHV